MRLNRMSLASLVAAVALAMAVAPSAGAAPFPGWGANPDYFATPSGRVACEYGTRHTVAGGTAVSCTDFSGSARRGQRTWSIKPRGRGRVFHVKANAPAEAKRARYGVKYRYHGITCRIRRTRGITCKNRSGHGFTLSAERHRTF